MLRHTSHTGIVEEAVRLLLQALMIHLHSELHFLFVDNQLWKKAAQEARPWSLKVQWQSSVAQWQRPFLAQSADPLFRDFLLPIELYWLRMRLSGQ